MVTTSTDFQAKLAQAEAFMLEGAKSELTAASAGEAVAHFRAGGFEIPKEHEADFEAMYLTTIAPDLALIRKAAAGDLESWPSLKCSACCVVCFAVAGLIVAVGAAALGGLSTTSGCVVALAELVGCSTTAALTFIQTLGKYVLAGVAAVVNAICIWTGAC